MSKTTYVNANVVPTYDTFAGWLTKTNQIIYDMGVYVLTTSNTSSPDITTGNAFVNGYFGSNTVYVTTGLQGGTANTPAALAVTSVLAVSNVSTFSGNVTITGSANASVNVNAVGFLANNITANNNLIVSNTATLNTATAVTANIATANIATLGVTGIGTIATVKATTANVTNMTVSGTANVAIANVATMGVTGVATIANATIAVANITNSTTSGTANIATANVATLGVTSLATVANATITTANITNSTTSGTANIATANVGTLGVTGVGTIATVRATTANLTTANVATLGVTSVATVVNATITVANITNSTTSGTANIATANVATLGVTGTATVATAVITTANITNSTTSGTANIATANVATLGVTGTATVDKAVITTANITNSTTSGTANIATANIATLGVAEVATIANATIAIANVTNTTISNTANIATANVTTLGVTGSTTLSNLNIGTAVTANLQANASTLLFNANTAANGSINATAYTGTAANATLFAGQTLATIQNQITGNAATAYANVIGGGYTITGTVAHNANVTLVGNATAILIVGTATDGFESNSTVFGVGNATVNSAGNSTSYTVRSAVGGATNTQLTQSSNTSTVFVQTLNNINATANVTSTTFTVNTTVLQLASNTLNGNVSTAANNLVANTTAIVFSNGSVAQATLNATSFSGTANNATNFGGLALATVQSQITGNAATAYTNAAAYADTKAATAYSNGTSYTDTKSTAAYTNAIAIANASIANGFWVAANATYAANTGAVAGVAVNPADVSDGYVLAYDVTQAKIIFKNPSNISTTLNSNTIVANSQLQAGSNGTVYVLNAYSNATSSRFDVNANVVNISVYSGAINLASNVAITNTRTLTIGTINATSIGLLANSTVLTIGNSSVATTINATSFSGTAANAALLGGVTLATVQGYATTNAAAAYSNAVTYVTAGNYTITGNLALNGNLTANSIATFRGRQVINFSNTSIDGIPGLATFAANGTAAAPTQTTTGATVFRIDTNAAINATSYTGTAYLSVVANDNITALARGSSWVFTAIPAGGATGYNMVWDGGNLKLDGATVATQTYASNATNLTTGTVSFARLPANLVFWSNSNVFTMDQTFNGNTSVVGSVNVGNTASNLTINATVSSRQSNIGTVANTRVSVASNSSGLVAQSLSINATANATSLTATVNTTTFQLASNVLNANVSTAANTLVVNTTAIVFSNGLATQATLNAASYSGTAANATLLAGTTLATIQGQITGNAATAYSNATSYVTAGGYSVTDTVTYNANIQLTGNATSRVLVGTVGSGNGVVITNGSIEVGNASVKTTINSTSIAVLQSQISGNAATAFSNAIANAAAAAAAIYLPTSGGTLSGGLTITGDLQVNGTTVYANVTNLDVTDKNITVAKGAASNSASDGAGITVDIPGATFTYSGGANTWNVNRGFAPGANLTLNLGSSALYWQGVFANTINLTGGATLNATSYSGTAANATLLGGSTLGTVQGQITGNAATAFSNAIANSAADASSKAGTAYSNAVAAAATDASTKASTAFSNAIANSAADASSKAGTAYSNAINTVAGTFSVTGVHTHTANIAMSNNHITRSTLAGYSEVVLTNATATGSPTLDLSLYNFFNLTLTGSITVAPSNVPASKAVTLTIVARQDATGGRTITWPANTKWPGGVVPPATTTANATDLWVLTTYDGGSTWFGALAGKAMA